MKNLVYPFSFLLFVMILSSCSKKYATSQSPDLNNHGTLAILPFEVEMRGSMPPVYSQEEVQEIEEEEGRNFQASLYYQMQDEPLFRRNRQWVKFQHYKTTNDKLADAGISIRDAWSQDPVALAEILGVDAVVSTKVDIEQYLNRGAGVIVRVLNIPPIFDPRNWAINSHLFVYCSIIDAQGGNAVWNYSVDSPTTVYRSPRRVMDEINQRISNRFPYKEYRMY